MSLQITGVGVSILYASAFLELDRLFVWLDWLVSMGRKIAGVARTGTIVINSSYSLFLSLVKPTLPFS
jgi:hypothetical protein